MKAERVNRAPYKVQSWTAPNNPPHSQSTFNPYKFQLEMSSTWIKPPMCSNIPNGVQCTNDANRYVCSRCRLVQYCSKDCQAAHWPAHKLETCKTR